MEWLVTKDRPAFDCFQFFTFCEVIIGIWRRVAISTSFLVLPFLLLAGFIAAQEQKKSSDKLYLFRNKPWENV